ncbi:MAG TPA: MAPEG family protein [Sphingomicrobium sp.]|nr:MAPEG family protein [Sphingomicrobium sp.]
MDEHPLLAPVAALVVWTLAVMVWMAITRAREFRRLGITRSNIPNGARGVDLEGRADPRAQWKAHNYMHLMEQPTLFYAVALSLAILGDKDAGTAAFAWAYVGLRVAHSLVQSTVNIVKYRLLLFVLSSVALLLLTIRLVALLLRAGG